MNYSILIYETPADFAMRSDPEKQQAYWAAWPPYSKALKDAGVFVSGAGLQTPETATTLRFRGEERLVQDGPSRMLKALTEEPLACVKIRQLASSWSAPPSRLSN